MLFGRYGLASDMIMHMSRKFLAVALFHYVDDFFGLESCSTAESSFRGFADFNRLVGCRMKKEKGHTASARKQTSRGNYRRLYKYSSCVANTSTA